jgi:hypothetical protein
VQPLGADQRPTRSPGPEHAALAPAESGRVQPRDELPARHRHGTEGHHLVVPLGRDVVVVAVEPPLGDAQRAGEAVQLVVRRVAGQV